MTEDSLILFGSDLVCNKSDPATKLWEKFWKRRTSQGTREDAASKNNLQHAQTAGTQPKIRYTAQVAKLKLLKSTECVVSGAEERSLFSEVHLFFITCAALRYNLKLESFEMCRASITTGLSYRTRLGRGLDADQPVNGHVPASLNHAIFYATVHNRDQIPSLCAPAGSIKNQRRPKKKFRSNQ